MLYREACGDTLSRLAFGTMRLPQMDGTPKDKWPHSCIGCGTCAAVCPQQIDIPAVMTEFAEMLDKAPSWEELCRQREEAAERLKAERD